MDNVTPTPETDEQATEQTTVQPTEQATEQATEQTDASAVKSTPPQESI